jgi:hypothetical protein
MVNFPRVAPRSTPGWLKWGAVAVGAPELRTGSHSLCTVDDVNDPS